MISKYVANCAIAKLNVTLIVGLTVKILHQHGSLATFASCMVVVCSVNTSMPCTYCEIQSSTKYSKTCDHIDRFDLLFQKHNVWQRRAMPYHTKTEP